MIEIVAIACGLLAVLFLLLFFIFLLFDIALGEKCMILSGFWLVMFLIFGVIAGAQQEEQKENACQAVNGVYKVVGTETTYVYDVNLKMYVPQEVDIYGCVK